MPPLRVLAAVHILSRVHTAVSLRVRSVTLLRTMSSKTSPLVTAAWLKDAIEKKEPNLQVLDASWHMPAFKRDAPKEYAEKHIPTAQFWQIGAYKSELATSEKFGEDLGKLGVGNDTHVVVYDSNPTFGLFSAPRAWWLLRYYGHENVSILDGGFPKWEEAGYETTDVVDKVEPKTFKANPNAALLRTMADIDANVENKKFTVIDGRPAGRFLGTSPEPRPGKSLTVPSVVCSLGESRPRHHDHGAGHASVAVGLVVVVQ